MNAIPETCSSSSSRWVQRLRFQDLPQKVVADAKLRLLDTLGVTLAASFTPAVVEFLAG